MENKPILVFIDTEFTELEAGARLISLGMVAEDDREFYAQSRDWALDDCSPFVLEVVIPLLSEDFLPLREVGAAAKRWIESLKREAILVTDSIEWDGLMLTMAFKECGWPSNARARLGYLSVEGTPGTIFERERVRRLMEGLREHHALDDAKVAKKAYFATCVAQPLWHPIF